ncbi:MAG: hypothetical protein K0S61_3934 [Anaerocolumna sp.]|jgi:predicted nucleic acid-binding protein|nr:hypothetical protein [Anaerocolumna sp.]
MKILLDTNIIIHRESATVVNEDIGVLFNWMDNLHYTKCIHPITISEISKYKDPKTLKSLNIKMLNYNTIKVEADWDNNVKKISDRFDKNENDICDSKLLNEVYCDRVDMLITEDRKIHTKAAQLGISDKVMYIDSFLEKVVTENPSLVDYKVLAVEKDYFGNINIDDPFFDSFKSDYVGFEKWFNKKSDEIAYICKEDDNLMAFLYLKVEDKNENYYDISPVFYPKKRLKIGTFKVTLNGFRLGERFIKIIIDNAIKFKVEEIYVTIFDNSVEQKRLIRLLNEFGFVLYGCKNSSSGKEHVLVRDFKPQFNISNPKITYPFISINTNFFLVPIYPEYHTNLLPDSILTTESAEDFKENEPFRNAISKVYITRSLEREIKAGDVIIFYRTGGYYESVITTIGVVEDVIINIDTSEEFIKICRKRSVFTDQELLAQWNYKRANRPFVVNFLYLYSFSKRITMKRLIEIGVIKDRFSAPRGFTKITTKNFVDIVEETKTNECIIVH